MDLLKEFLAQVGTLPTVWMPFVLTVAVVAIIIWRYLNHHYSERLAAAGERLKLRDDRIAEYERKAGATPDEAKARIERLEAELTATRGNLEQVGPRMIGDAQAEAMISILRNHRSAVKLIVLSGTSDGGALSGGLKKTFQSAGWKVGVSSAHSPGGASGLAGGLALLVRDQSNLDAEESCILAALKAAGLNFSISEGRASPDREVNQLMIGERH